MAGVLQKHPYYKTYDELQRSIKRMETYLNMNVTILSSEEVDKITDMIDFMEHALVRIPDEYRVTKHFQYKEK